MITDISRDRERAVEMFPSPLGNAFVVVKTGPIKDHVLSLVVAVVLAVVVIVLPVVGIFAVAVGG